MGFVSTETYFLLTTYIFIVDCLLLNTADNLLDLERHIMKNSVLSVWMFLVTLMVLVNETVGTGKPITYLVNQT